MENSERPWHSVLCWYVDVNIGGVQIYYERATDQNDIIHKSGQSRTTHWAVALTAERRKDLDNLIISPKGRPMIRVGGTGPLIPLEQHLGYVVPMANDKART